MKNNRGIILGILLISLNQFSCLACFDYNRLEEDTIFITFEGKYRNSKVRVVVDNDSVVFRKRLKHKAHSVIAFADQINIVGDIKELEIKIGFRKKRILVDPSFNHIFVRKETILRPFAVEYSNSPRLYW